MAPKAQPVTPKKGSKPATAQTPKKTRKTDGRPRTRPNLCRWTDDRIVQAFFYIIDECRRAGTALPWDAAAADQGITTALALETAMGDLRQRIDQELEVQENEKQDIITTFLDLVYHLHVDGSPVPWAEAADQVQQGVSGDALRQKLEKMRIERERAGLRVPPHVAFKPPKRKESTTLREDDDDDADDSGSGHGSPPAGGAPLEYALSGNHSDEEESPSKKPKTHHKLGMFIDPQRFSKREDFENAKGGLGVALNPFQALFQEEAQPAGQQEEEVRGCYSPSGMFRTSVERYDLGAAPTQAPAQGATFMQATGGEAFSSHAPPLLTMYPLSDMANSYGEAVPVWVDARGIERPYPGRVLWDSAGHPYVIPHGTWVAPLESVRRAQDMVASQRREATAWNLPVGEVVDAGRFNSQMLGHHVGGPMPPAPSAHPPRQHYQSPYAAVPTGGYAASGAQRPRRLAGMGTASTMQASHRAAPPAFTLPAYGRDNQQASSGGAAPPNPDVFADYEGF